jgi:hypothetical protein
MPPESSQVTAGAGVAIFGLIDSSPNLGATHWIRARSAGALAILRFESGYSGLFNEFKLLNVK